VLFVFIWVQSDKKQHTSVLFLKKKPTFIRKTDNVISKHCYRPEAEPPVADALFDIICIVEAEDDDTAAPLFVGVAAKFVSFSPLPPPPGVTLDMCCGTA
jgi:hypothetical protein